MKTNSILKMGLSIALIATLCFVSFKSFAQKTTEDPTAENVTITIDSNTSADDFNDIKNMLKDNDITAAFNNIERNDLDKLIGLEIVLKDSNGNQTASQTSSNMPISQITFGRKDGLLFISQSNVENGAFAFFNRPNMMPFQFSNDSIPSQSFGNFNFDDFFNDKNGSFFFNGKSMTLNELKEQMEKQFESTMGGSHNFFGSNNNSTHNNRFNFIDNPETEKLIIIDGKESDFETLNKLAESNLLEDVDVLKSKTAMSVYGNKAKDGAIIATTKK